MEIIVDNHYTKVRADKVLGEALKDQYSRTTLQELFALGHVTRAGAAIDKKTPVNGGDVLNIFFPAVAPTELRAVEMPLDILYEDEDLIVLNKRAGQVVHPGSGTGEDTLVHALLHYTSGKLSLAAGDERPGVVHRLDKETSGLMVFAKTDAAYLRLIEAFSARTIRKEYLAWVSKVPSLLAGSIKTPIGRHPVSRTKMAIVPSGRPAHTDWELEHAFGKAYARLRCYLHTGRTHQIRVHLSSIGSPIIGDGAYGYRVNPQHALVAPRVMLHAERLAFAHPITGKMLDLRAPWSPDIQALNKQLLQLFG